MTGAARVTYGSAGVAPRPAVVPVEESSQVGAARRAAAALAESLGFDETAQGRAALVATEVASNLVKHARGGVLFVQASRAAGAGEVPPAVELIAVDRGPGMADPTAALRDGYSTSGTSGAGLGAIRRIADYFEMDSHPGHGTVVLAHVAARPSVPAHVPPVDDGRLRVDVGAVCVPIAGEHECGDAWAAFDDDGALAVLLADGLGHGEAAAVAAEAATRTFVASTTRGEVDPRRLLDAVHGALRGTRGAAVSLATIDRRESTVRFVGIGNVAGVIVPVDEPTATRSLVALSGIVGHQMRTLQEFVYPLPAAGALLILASDGVRPMWRFEQYPGLARRHPAIVAATLWRDHARGRDDASVVVTRLTRSGGPAT
jgi:anti-sigma regulatory factor (Ser/Thr protein kinase)